MAQKNWFAFISFGEIQFLPPCVRYPVHVIPPLPHLNRKSFSRKLANLRPSTVYCSSLIALRRSRMTRSDSLRAALLSCSYQTFASATPHSAVQWQPPLLLHAYTLSLPPGPGLTPQPRPDFAPQASRTPSYVQLTIGSLQGRFPLLPCTCMVITQSQNT
jgi:hypothetical protein